MLDTNDPGTSYAIAQYTAVPARAYHGFADAALSDDGDSTINCITLRYAAKIDPHRVIVKADPVVCKFYMMIVDRGKFLRN